MRNNREAAVLKPEVNQNDCVHYWIIEYPEGPVSTGRCKYCGKVKHFYNSLDSLELRDDDHAKTNRNN